MNIWCFCWQVLVHVSWHNRHLIFICFLHFSSENSCFHNSPLTRQTFIVNRYSQWFDRWAPLAGNNFHDFKATVVQLNLRGVVILCVDLAGPQRTTVLRLNIDTQSWIKIRSDFKSKAMFNDQKNIFRQNTLYMLLVFFLGLASYTN